MNAPMSKFRIVIVGAGPAGLTAAAYLVERGHQVTVIERDPQYVGGISRTVERDGFRFDIGGHRFFSKSEEVTAWWKARLPRDFIEVRRLSRIYYRGKFFDYPLKPLNALRGLGLLTSLICLASYARARLLPAKTETSFADWVSNRFGRRLFEIFFKSYTEKVWGMPCEEISADWAAQRIKGLSLPSAVLHALGFGRRAGPVVVKTLIDTFQYPRLGPGMMWEKTRDDIVRAGGRVIMDQRVTGLTAEGDRVVAAQSVDSDGAMRRWEGDHFILSMPLQETVAALSPGLECDVTAAAARLRYRDFLTVALVLEGPNPFPDNWIYVHDPSVRLGRIQNYRNWSTALVPGPNRTCLGLEYFCFKGDDLWRREDGELIELAERELTKLGFIRDIRISAGYVVRMEKAYPVYYPGFADDVARIRRALARFTNLQVVGRNGMHKYNNQDHSMMTALLAARNVEGAAFDVWKVNSDAEYHEEAVPGGGRADRR
jgi:protoporphyrinogen oxidase